MSLDSLHQIGGGGDKKIYLSDYYILFYVTQLFKK